MREEVDFFPTPQQVRDVFTQAEEQATKRIMQYAKPYAQKVVEQGKEQVFFISAIYFIGCALAKKKLRELGWKFDYDMNRKKTVKGENGQTYDEFWASLSESCEDAD